MKLIFLFLYLCIFPSPVFAETIRLASGEWPPFCSQELKYFGMGSRIITEAFAYEGVEVDYTFLPWARGHDLAKSNKLNGIIFYSRNPEREMNFFFSDPILTVDKVFFHLHSYSFDWQSVEDLEGLVIGATIDYDFGDDFRQAERTEQIKVERITTDVANLRKLIAGRIHLFPTMIESGYATILQEFPEHLNKITHHSTPVQTTEMHLMLPKKSTNSLKLIEKFNLGLKKLKASGRYDQFFIESRSGAYIVQ